MEKSLGEPVITKKIIYTIKLKKKIYRKIVSKNDTQNIEYRFLLSF